jgi:hypothetical protein
MISVVILANASSTTPTLLASFIMLVITLTTDWRN